MQLNASDLIAVDGAVGDSADWIVTIGSRFFAGIASVRTGERTTTLTYIEFDASNAKVSFGSASRGASALPCASKVQFTVRRRLRKGCHEPASRRYDRQSYKGGYCPGSHSKSPPPNR